MKYSKKNTVTKKVYKRKAKAISKPNVTSLVKQIIYKECETKQNSITQSYTLFNSGISSTSEQYSLLPVIVLGTNSFNRIGDTIRPIKLVIRGVITSFADYSTGNEPYAQMLRTRLFVYQDKSIKCEVDKNSCSLDVLDYGNSMTAYTGSLLDNTVPNNKQKFQFFADKKHTIHKPYGWTNSSTSALTSMHSSMVKPFTIVIEKGLPAVLHYDNNKSTNYPTNFLPLLSLGYSYAQNTSPDTVRTQIGASWQATLYYKDA